MPEVQPVSQNESVPARVIAERYQVESKLGEGGMGVVYRVFDRRLGRHAAMKMMIVRRDAAREERFVREARAMARVEHAHCVRVYDMGVTPEGEPYFVMELAPGKSLIELLDEKGPLAPKEAA